MRVALGVSYNGQGYEGWQSQPSGRTVQDQLERALAQFAATPVSTICAGRTDTGVHGLMQVVHFDTGIERDPHAWVRGTNRYLPADIAIQWAQPVAEGFHARFSATGRRYAYVLLESQVRPSVEAGRVGWSFRALDGAAMREAAAALTGTHDFSSFRASSCQARSPVKTLRHIGISSRGEGPARYWRFDFEADAFLHHMIRNLMGSLLQVGQGLQPPGWMAQVLAARSRGAAAPTFSPDGLYFMGPIYDTHWGLPARAAAYDWLP